ncbi:MAG: hypothetical protein KDD40_05695 [Bdellovibrionales bacterium]|nr:hypothetical protein [Bdellovibrionales bacterium]
MKNQTLKTLDLGILVVLSVCAFMVFVTLIQTEKKDPERAKALLGAQNLALQLAAGGLGTLQVESLGNERNIASVEKYSDYKRSIELFGKQGKIGRDPWGNAFRYGFIEQDVQNKKEAYVVVWSDGPNGLKETEFDELLNFKLKRNSTSEIHLNYDDVGYVRALEVN